MAVIVGSFLTQDEAEQAYLRLRTAGYADENLALISNVVSHGSPDAGMGPHDGAAAATERGAGSSAGEASEATGPALLTPEATGQSEERRVDAAALGAAIGLIAGGGLFGPVGAVLGTAAGGGIGAALAGRGVAQSDADAYATHLREGRYLVAVETDHPDAEVRAVMERSGAGAVQVEA